MKAVLIVFAILVYTTGYCQNKCSAIVDVKYSGIVAIYDTVNGKIIDTARNDLATEDFLHMEILDETDTYFRVSISLNSKKENKPGWIKKADYIGAYIRHEKFPMHVILYRDKVVTELNKITINDWQPELLTIKKCSGPWTFVSLNKSGEQYEGWIETVNLCANAYTYCN